MQIIWASAAPKTRNEFFKIFPRRGFCLVGRASGKKDSAPEKILQKAIESTLNERLPLHHGKRLVLVGPPSIVDNSHVLSFLDKAADVTLNETMSIVSTSRRTAVTLLGFGIELVAQNEHRHREFCLELLHARGFIVHRESAAYVHGEFSNGRKVVIGFSSSERSLDHVSATIYRTSAKTRCILANFALNTLGVEHYWSRKIAVFHYSLLDAYLKGNMSSPPRPSWK
jgi:hypothetical protein